MKKLVTLFVLLGIALQAGAAPINVSTGKQATASSLWGGNNANMATDGITDAPWPIFHSGRFDYNPWLLIDLEQTELVSEITLWARQDCCWLRMRDLQVEILDEFLHVVYTSELINPDNILGITDYTIPLITLSFDNPIPGWYVRVSRFPYSQADGDGYYLQLNEVEIFADGQKASVASAPSPYNGEINVPLSVTLSWDASLLDDPNTVDPPYVNPNLIRHELYLSNGLPADPNLHLLASIPAGDSRVAYGPIAVNRDEVYYWRVDEIIPDPNNPAVEKAVTGVTWKFDVLPSLPVIDPSGPVGLFVNYGQEAVFSVSAINPFTGDGTNLSYAWYKSVDNANDTPADDTLVGTSSTLTIAAAQGSDQGHYYCKVTNIEAGSSLSNAALLFIKQEMARYEFDAATDGAGVYTDVHGNYPGIMVNPSYARTYTADVNGNPNAAIVMDAGSLANAGTWDPSGLTGQITVSCWVNWTGPRGSGTYQGIVGKANGWGTTNKWSWRTDNNNANLRWFRNAIWGPDITLTNDTQWQFLCMTVANNTATAYINGEPIGSTAFTFGSGNNDPVWIGTAENNMGRWFNGAMDDLRIFNYALTFEEVIDLYNAKADSDISVCLNQTPADRNGDCKVNLLDFAELASDWMTCGLYPIEFCN
jgi:hypothetical protein